MEILMIDENVPAIEIIKTVIGKIDRIVKIERVKYVFDKMEHNFLLSKDSKTCEVSIPRGFLDDLNDYTGSRESRYWIALEGALKRRLSIPMQIAGLIPFSSDIFFEDKQEWEQDNGQNIEVYFSESDYEVFQDGLNELYHYLEEQKNELSHLKLKTLPYAEEQQRIHDMLLHRNKQISNNGPCPFRDRISVTSRKHLKAAVLMQFLFYENELTQGDYTEAVKREIAAKMIRILQLLTSPIFERIEVAEYLCSIRKNSNSGQSQGALPDNPQKRDYDVVLSFAGEDREYAEKLAAMLTKDGFGVFYDKYEEHDLWGKNLYEHLTEVYSKQGKYCVMFISKHYAIKEWPRLERRAAQAKALKEITEYILPVRIDDTEIPGIPDTVGYQDLREKSIEAIYEILKRKLLPVEEAARVKVKTESL